MTRRSSCRGFLDRAVREGECPLHQKWRCLEWLRASSSPLFIALSVGRRTAEKSAPIFSFSSPSDNIVVIVGAMSGEETDWSYTPLPTLSKKQTKRQIERRLPLLSAATLKASKHVQISTLISSLSQLCLVLTPPALEHFE